ncbi:MAG TPA: 2-oxoacid:ferredoxin oxidoreductase subunit beta [Chloroflexota bacterium]|jgi:2-oxoglutarate ferredoxin oxidoreductase subunit beta|nr:2-oxoacid:ferredoxin oxidoreductase subunit beta [Chloroflexota bacterium]
MAIDTPVRERTVEDYKSDEKPTWCPGCGDFGVLNAVYRALRIKNFEPHQVVAVSGIGCSSRIPYFISTYGFHGIHGRTMPIATGVHVARPDLKTIVFGGDGDAFAIGAGHFVHAMRRNLDLTYVVMDNAIYGLTKGQTSPTSGSGFNTLSTPQGNPEQALNPMLMAIASGATFVARGFSAEPQKLADLIVEGINHKGFSFIDVYSPCPTFNKVNTFKTYKEAVQPLPADHDPSNTIQALNYANSQDPLYLGVFHRREAPTFGEQVDAQHSGDESQRQKVLESLFNRFS